MPSRRPSLCTWIQRVCGRGQQARAALAQKTLHTNAFKKRELVRGFFENNLKPSYDAIRSANYPPATFLDEIVLLGLAAFWAENSAQILELEKNGDSCFHPSFHAIGSGADTAYAVYRTLGGTRLSDLDEPKALLALIRMVRTCVNVEMWGVSEPVWFWVVGPKGARRVSQDELQPQVQTVDKWEQLEQEAFFNDRWPLSD